MTVFAIATVIYVAALRWLKNVPEQADEDEAG
jgi:hypothetical protein